MDRTILHCDCNGFYASVEGVRDPALRRVPMAVCGDPEHRHGVILAKNELAKQRGVRTAETVFQARQKCPGLVLVPPHRELYEEYSRRVNAIYARYTDMVEPFGIDESWLDVTGSRRLFGGGQAIADALRRTVREETGLTISVGVSFNKIFAKLGSDYRKPDATTVITRENYKQVVFPLPAAALLYVGDKAAATLAGMGIHTIGELAGADPYRLTRALGRLGEMLHRYACGLDVSPVRLAAQGRDIQSVGNNMTFPRDLTGEEDVRAGVLLLADSVAERLRRQGLWCRTVQVIVKNPALQTISRQQPLRRPTNLAAELAAAAMDILRRSWSMDKPIRMLSLTGLQLTDRDEGEQLSLFDDGEGERHDKRERLETAMDRIRLKYGRAAIRPGAAMRGDLGGETPENRREKGDAGK